MPSGSVIGGSLCRFPHRKVDRVLDERTIAVLRRWANPRPESAAIAGRSAAFRVENVDAYSRTP